MNVSLNLNDDDVVDQFFFGLLGVPVTSFDSLATRIGIGLAFEETGKILVRMAEKFYHSDRNDRLRWSRELLRATIAGGLPASVNRDRWQERCNLEQQWARERAEAMA